jgi:hypothetical protein
MHEHTSTYVTNEPTEAGQPDLETPDGRASHRCLVSSAPLGQRSRRRKTSLARDSDAARVIPGVEGLGNPVFVGEIWSVVHIVTLPSHSVKLTLLSVKHFQFLSLLIESAAHEYGCSAVFAIQCIMYKGAPPPCEGGIELIHTFAC